MSLISRMSGLWTCCLRFYFSSIFNLLYHPALVSHSLSLEIGAPFILGKAGASLVAAYLVSSWRHALAKSSILNIVHEPLPLPMMLQHHTTHTCYDVGVGVVGNIPTLE